VGAREVHSSPVTHFSRLLVPAFGNLHSSHQQDGEANDENLLDHSSLRHLDAPPTASCVTWHAAPSGANRPFIEQLDDPSRPFLVHTIAAGPLLSFGNTSVVPHRQRFGPDGDIDGVHGLSVPRPSAKPRQHDNSLLHPPSSLPTIATGWGRALGSTASALRHILLVKYLIGGRANRDRATQYTQEPSIDENISAHGSFHDQEARCELNRDGRE
jgi:hypothetical protein